MKKTGIFCILLLLSAFAVLAQPSSKAVHKALSPFVEQRQIGGVVAVVADRDKIISMDCLGYADIENNRKMSGESLFWIASQSKPICATALMMLVDEGKVDLDAPVTDYLPELKPLMVRRIKRDGWQVEERPSRPVTLRHLLSHTSGMDWIAGVQAQMGKIDVLPFCLSLRVSAMTPCCSNRESGTAIPTRVSTSPQP